MRDYYFHYYGSWGGYHWQKAARTRELYIMKNLSNLPMWIGDNVHWHINWIINRFFKYKRPVSIEEALSRLHKNMEIDWYISRTSQYIHEPKKVPGLVEHFYNEPIGEAEFEKAYSDAERSLKHFFEKSTYRQILDDPSINLVSTEKFDNFPFEDFEVKLRCDLILQWNGKTYIIDWKTNKRIDDGDDNLQLAVYALNLIKKRIADYQEIDVILSNLHFGEETIKNANPELLDWAEEEIISSANQMRALLRDPVNNIAHEEDYPMTEDVLVCKTCNFRKACEYPM